MQLRCCLPPLLPCPQVSILRSPLWEWPMQSGYRHGLCGGFCSVMRTTVALVLLALLASCAIPSAQAQCGTLNAVCPRIRSNFTMADPNGGNVTLPPVLAWNACGNVTDITCDRSNNTLYPEGTYTMRCNATVGSQSASCSFDFTVGSA